MRERHGLLRLLLFALLLYALGSFTAARWELQRQQVQTRELEGKIQTLLAEGRELDERLEAVEDAALLRRLAWERLRMVMPGERVFAFSDPEEASG